MSFRKIAALAGCLLLFAVSGARADRQVVGIVTMDVDETLMVQMDIRRPGRVGIDHSAFEIKKGDPGYQAMLLRVGGLSPRQQKLLFSEESETFVKE
jgi:hypothetical protein